MARVSRVETCILCDCTPCECNKKSPKTVAVRVRARLESPPVSREKLAPPRRAVSEEDLMLAEAIRMLAPILHPLELERYSGLLAIQPSTADRASIWRARRASHG